MPKPSPKVVSAAVSKAEKELAELSLSRYCETRIPPHARGKVRLVYRWRGGAVTLFEERPVYDDPSRWSDCPVAQFRFDRAAKRWALYCADRNSRWRLYDDADPAKSLQTLLEEVESDPTGIFWG